MGEKKRIDRNRREDPSLFDFVEQKVLKVVRPQMKLIGIGFFSGVDQGAS